MRRILTFLIAVFCLPGSGFGQVEIQDLSEDTARVLALIEASKGWMETNLGEAQLMADSALQLATSINYEKGMAKANEQLGTAKYYSSQLDEAIPHYQAAVDYYLNNDQEHKAAKMNTNIGLVKRNLGKLDEAMTHFFQSLEIVEELGVVNSIASTQNHIGATFAIQGNYEEAEKYFNMALEGFQEAGNEARENSLLLNIGGFYQETGELDKALVYVKQCMEYFAENGPVRELARGYYILGGIHLDRDELEPAANAYRKSKKYFEDLGSAMRINGCVLHLCEIAYIQGNYNQAEQWAEEALATATSSNIGDQIAKSYNWLAKINRAQGQHNLAYDYLEAARAQEDSILNESTNRTIAELEEKYESELKERKLTELEATNQLNELALKKQRERQWLLIIFAALIAMIAVLLFNRYRIKQRANQKLTEKNQLIQSSLAEKEVLLREIHHRVKNNLQFISSLLNLQSRHVSDPKTLQVLNEGKNRINSMALVHQKLYQEDNLTGVDMANYIPQLLDALSHAYRVDRTKVSVETNVDPLVLDIDTATPIGLILNELITNAFKYAFQGREHGKLRIDLKEESDQLILEIADDGVGVGNPQDLEQSQQFGFELVRSLATQLQADIAVKTEDGVKVKLQIKKYKKT